MQKRPIKILLIEDELLQAKILEAQLQKKTENDFSLLWADSLQKGKKYISSSQIDIILLDLNLPDSSGIDTFKQVYKETPNIPIIVLSSLNDKTIAIETVKLGAQDYLVKGTVDRHLLQRSIHYSIERKKSEEITKKILKTTDTILKGLPIGIMIVNDEKQIIQANKIALNIINQTKDKIIGRSCKEIFKQTKFNNCYDCDLNKKMENYEQLISGQNEDKVYILKTALPITLEGKDVMVEAFVDITKQKDNEQELSILNERLEQRVYERTNELKSSNVKLESEINERKRTEKALRHSEERLTQIIQSNSMPIFAIDTEHIVTHWNVACENLTGVPAYEIIGTKNHWKAFYDKKRSLLIDLILEKKSERKIKKNYQFKKSSIVEDTFEGEAYLQALDKWLFIAASPVKDINGDIIGAIETIQDISERKIAEQLLKKAKEDAEETARIKSQFILNISHELRTPLNAIIGFSENIINTQSIDTVHDQTKTILHESKTLLNLINDLLDYSKIDNRNLQLKVHPFNLHDMLKNINNSYQNQAEIKGLIFDMSLTDTIPKYVKGDSIRFQQILIKLLDNAIKFTEKGSIKVEINELECSNKNIELNFIISDTGIGIPKDKQHLTSTVPIVLNREILSSKALYRLMAA